MLSITPATSAAGLDCDHGFAGTCNRIRHVGEHEIVGLAILRAEDGFHGGT
jgi:hypothetical protein